MSDIPAVCEEVLRNADNKASDSTMRLVGVPVTAGVLTGLMLSTLQPPFVRSDEGLSVIKLLLWSLVAAVVTAALAHRLTQKW